MRLGNGFYQENRNGQWKKNQISVCFSHLSLATTFPFSLNVPKVITLPSPSSHFWVSFTGCRDVYAALRDVNELLSILHCLCHLSSLPWATLHPTHTPASVHTDPFIVICTETLVVGYFGDRAGTITFVHPLSAWGVSKLLAKDKIHGGNWGQSNT